jgi:predicted HicB family RNase H-like nuclease
MLAISNDKTRIMVTLPKELKDKLEAEAINQNRSLSNYILTILQKKVDK